MTLSKTSIQTLRHVVLVPPRQERKYFSKCWQGTVEPIADSDNLAQDGRSLYFRSKYRGDFEALRKEIEIALRKKRVTAASAQLAEAVIAMAVAYRQIGATAAVDELLDNTSSVQAIVFIGLPEMTASLGDGAVEAFLGFRFGRFTVGMEALRTHERLFGKEKRNANYEKVSSSPGLWFMREPLDCTLLAAAFDQRISSMTQDHYLLLISSELGSLRDEFLADQRIFAALDVPTFDGERIFSLHGLRIDVAFGESARTQVMLVDYATDIIPGGIGRLGECAERLNSQTTIPFDRCVGIDRSLKNFAAFLQKAHAHDLGGRSSDAFIHYVFALDLLLGSKENSTRSVSNRASIIYSGSSGRPFHEVRKDMQALYDYRSKYVHGGKEIPPRIGEEMAEVCRSVMECLLKVRNFAEANTENYIVQIWHRQLDYLAAAMDARADAPDEHFEKCGVVPPRRHQLRGLH